MKKAIVFLSFILSLSMVLLACDKTSEATTTSNLPATTTSGFMTTTTYTNTTIPTTTEVIETTNNIISYQVDFDTNGGNQIDSMEAERGYPILLPVPHKIGYTFLGWYTSEDPFFYEFTLFNQVVADMTLYAKWEINLYSLSFDTQGGDSLATKSIEFNDDIVLSSPTRIGHTFIGWYEDDEYTKPFDLEVMPANNFTLYAKWSTNTYKLTYHYDYPVDAEVSFSLVGMGYSHTIAVVIGGKVFAWGSNYAGQLGDGTTEKRNFPVDITDNIPLLESEYITKIECGAYYTLLLTNQSRLLGFGSNSSFQLAMTSGSNSTLPIDMTDAFSLVGEETIVDVVAGDYFNILLTSNGRVLTWGSNSNGELGIGTAISDQLVHDITDRFNLDPLDSIVKIGSGKNFGVVISENKRVFTWGFNYHGQLGDGSTINRLAPVEITASLSLNIGETISIISASHDFIHVVTNNGRIFAWGLNSNGFYGNGTNTSSLVPLLINPDFDLGVGEKINYMSSGYNYVFAISSQYRVFVWGVNYYNEFGIDEPASSNTPIEITEVLDNRLHFPIIELATGGNATIFLSSYGTLATAGNATYGQLGDLDVSILHTPTIYVTETYNLLYNELINHPLISFDDFVFDGWFVDSEHILLSDYLNMPATDIDLYGTFIRDDS